MLNHYCDDCQQPLDENNECRCDFGVLPPALKKVDEEKKSLNMGKNNEGNNMSIKSGLEHTLGVKDVLNIPLDIFLTNGVKINGKLVAVDENAGMLGLVRDGHRQSINYENVLSIGHPYKKPQFT